MDTQKLFTEKDCIRSMYDSAPKNSNAGCWGILKPEVLKKEYRKADMQLRKLKCGFGCNPDASGNACFCDSINGEQGRWERYDFIGIANQEVSAWAESQIKKEI